MSKTALLAAAAGLLFLTVGIGGCKSDAEKFCFDRKPVDYKTLTACGEACDKKNAKACARMAKLGHTHCFEKKQVRFCDYMCAAARSGKDLFCKERDKLQQKADQGK